MVMVLFEMDAIPTGTELTEYITAKPEDAEPVTSKKLFPYGRLGMDARVIF